MGKRFRNALGTILLALVASAAGASAQSSVTLHGRVLDPGGLPLPGVTVTLVGTLPAATQTAVSDGNGAYSFAAPPGRYHLKAQLEGFDLVDRPVDLSGGELAIDLTLHLASHQEQVTVTADQPASVVAEARPDAPETVTREVVDAGMLPNSQYDDVLPLLPNVVRGPDGLISVAGARALQGALFVNGMNETDPASGQPALILPIEAIDSVDVFSGGYSAELGRATGGVTSVHTRAGADTFHSSFTSFFPRMRFLNGGIAGIDFWEPNAGASGPIVKGRLFYEEAISYRFDRNKFGTVVGRQDQKFNEIASWTQLDLQVSPGQHLVWAFAFNPQNTDHANITAFTPAGTVPRLRQRSFTASLSDRLAVGTTTTLEVRANVVRTSSTLTPQGNDPYEVGHDLTRGNYYDTQGLQGGRVEGGAVLSRTAGPHHLVRIGATGGSANLSGNETSAPVDFLRSDGSIAESVSFLPAEPIAVRVNELSAFAQDTWNVTKAVTLDAGIRYDHAGGSRGVVSPRAALTVKLPDDRSTIGASAGVFGDKVPLEALAFPSLPARTITTLDSLGTPVGPGLVLTNVMGAPLKTPVATRWDVEFDRHLSSGWLARVKYQERRGRDELVVDPVLTSATNAILALDNTGTSRSRSVETTIAWRNPKAGNEFYVSYVRAATQGNVNALDVIEGMTKQALIQPDGVGPLPADVPNRLLAWGVLHLPRDITVAPFVEVRNGFPYTAIADDWSRVGLPNSYRLPWFGSLDLYVNKIFRLSNRLPAARIGLKVYSLASVHSERDVQRDIQRPDFGTTYNAIPRDYAGVFELLWGNK